MDEFETFTIPGRKARRIDFLILGLGIAKDLLDTVSGCVEVPQDLLLMHANWQVDREQFAEEAAMELETLLVGEDEWEDESGEGAC